MSNVMSFPAIDLSAILYDELLNNMISSVTTILDDIYSHCGWELVILDVLVHHQRQSTTVLPLQVIHSADSNEDFLLTGDIENIVESTFLRMYDIAVRHQKKSWNKVRVAMGWDAAKSYKLEYKYDDDLNWLDTLSVHNLDYTKLSFYEESKIKTWEGLPSFYKRFWAPSP